MSKSLLVINRQSPWSGPSARETLDIVLAGGAFDLPIGLLFLDDGVFQLAPHQDAKAVQQKDLSANLQALGLFGIDEVFACSHSLAERGLSTPANAQPLDTAAICELIDRYDQVITL
ncbi:MULTISPECIES: sulfurtransferase complex subunit TusC [Pseudomonas]|jgi:tRNA 2-thiouridine synthesizing protein C|uniref:Sulfurtransferase complex subunit TusC n=1 Tax=Pseudomonas simiae TaxID=321846 RepID=A0ABS9G9K8_9PSED|nr:MULTISPECIES: sulfurtransferase complex subunit TusC [Pseudomonas]PHX35407.1 sulfur relay protein TusC [Pseudomonas sp. NZIPFR-PS2]AJZ95582.1 sulfur relay protein TusC [Pseudomonas simiae]KIQ06902.1 sulfur relay protein TusC [Pseudomonas simiae]MBC3965433.1 sulfurtransferase complex subunit TusC [Pseudomonas simiae]MBJ2230163.1 sulfurtransferase complex subunit TusC [Pseudomonas simiae]